MLNFTGDRALHVSSCLHMRLCNQIDITLELAYGQPTAIVGVSELLSRAKASLDPKQHRSHYPRQTFLGLERMWCCCWKAHEHVAKTSLFENKLQHL
ncbi:hypothetical protein HBH56_142010 [Parastagonospora nodorum]|uniref:Uncharacterized protein n=1 Tax=Phaeosphaeria nodorum (strain SN15 / ATCC MYA-4574 / FGSC 10173) TaxID=321614 RepID=A0A7U2I6U5_PHANO|nr:hypothetical protein HBH56_142010 [Parastagonospora nodorum]QRD01608.1 hypothetical protein JI435_417060 [Parastagonospora nodorum SN15]KAH3927693.1 hypothetical protein HBH54_147200 [Parastagonospora nodorum]KAH3947836.1 hypothetical protein HBH53_107280 [Parastagonospora nodorum]KAH4031567.1 hypothetical protein HBI09_126320 [Parastagonospora nodorum]